MSTPTTDYGELLEQLPADSTLTLHRVTWEDYEALLEAVGEATGLRISFDGEALQIMTLSAEHGSYSDLIKLLVGQLSLKLRIKILFFGSATMKKRREQKGSEPDGCFYVQGADLLGGKKDSNFNTDPPPDVVVEVDIHHDSLFKFPIYAALEVPEIWRYNGQALTIYHLQQGQYAAAESSRALPMLNSRVLTELLNRSHQEDQYATLLAFEQWLQLHQP